MGLYVITLRMHAIIHRQSQARGSLFWQWPCLNTQQMLMLHAQHVSATQQLTTGLARRTFNFPKMLPEHSQKGLLPGDIFEGVPGRGCRGREGGV